MDKSNLNEPSEVNLTGCTRPEEIAQRERWETNEWAVAMAARIRNLSHPLDAQRERLAALVATGAVADSATAETLGQHVLMLEALFQRFTSEALRASEGGGARSVERVDAFLRSALKAQRASVACLSALKALRDQPSPTRAKPSARPRPVPATQAPTTPKVAAWGSSDAGDTDAVNGFVGDA